MNKEKLGGTRHFKRKGGSIAVGSLIDLSAGSDKPPPTGDKLRELIEFVNSAHKSPPTRLFVSIPRRDKPSRFL